MNAETRPEASEMAPPDPQRPPLRANIFDFMTKANTALVPLFPYLGPGCIVPTGSIFRGGRDYGVFEHFNTVDEVAICFAAHNARIRPGQVAAGPKKHRVGGFFASEDETALILTTVTQRQAEGAEPQHEAASFVCEKCQEPLVLHNFNAKPDASEAPMPDGYEQRLDTIVETLHAAEILNGDPARRICARCGHENAPFPAELWGWRRYREQVAIAREGWQQYAGVIAGAAE